MELCNRSGTEGEKINALDLNKSCPGPVFEMFVLFDIIPTRDRVRRHPKKGEFFLLMLGVGARLGDTTLDRGEKEQKRRKRREKGCRWGVEGVSLLRPDPGSLVLERPARASERRQLSDGWLSPLSFISAADGRPLLTNDAK